MAGLLAGSVDFYNNSTVEGNVHSEPDVWVCGEVAVKGRELLRGQGIVNVVGNVLLCKAKNFNVSRYLPSLFVTVQ